MPLSGRPRLNPSAPLTGAERQARRRQRGHDAITRIETARRVIARADKAARLCGDLEVVSAWLELCEILGRHD